MSNTRTSYDNNGIVSIKKDKVKGLISLIKGNMLILILLLLMVIGAIASPVFLSMFNMNNILINIAIFGLLAVGQSVVMIVKEIDLSVGAILAFGPIAAVAVTDKLMSMAGSQIIMGGNYVVAGLVPIAFLILVISTLVGLLNGILRVKAQVPSLLVTLGMMYTLGGLSYILSGGYSLYLTRLDGINLLGTGKIANISMSFILFIIFSILVISVLKLTKIGHRIYSVGGNEKAAIYSGINPGFWKIAAFGFSGLCAGISALVYSSRLESIETIQGSGYELIAIAIAVIGGVTLEGGRGKIFDVVLASTILAIALNILSLIGLGSWYQNIIIGCIIIGAALQHSLSYKRALQTK